MKPLSKPPDWEHHLSQANSWAILENPAAVALIQHANNEYWHWDKFRRHHPLPKGIEPEALWAMVKLTRMIRRTFDLRDTRGREFTYWLPDSAQRYLHEIDKGLVGRIGADAPTSIDQDRERYILSSLQEEAIASSMLEGAATTRKEARDLLRREKKPRTQGERMVVNNYATIMMLREWKTRAFSIDAVLEIHRAMTRDTLDNPLDEGRLRTTDDVHVYDIRDNTVLHTPPHATELSARLQLLCEFANAGGRDDAFLHPVIRAILIHFWLAYDHPFVDGNGRTARALFYWSMLRAGYWLFEFLPISRVITRAPIKYGRAFIQAENDDCDATYFIMYNLRAIDQALRDLHEYLARQQERAGVASRLLAESPELNLRQADLLRSCLEKPLREITIGAYRGRWRVSYGTAYNDLAGLEQLGMLKRIKHGRTWLYFPVENLAERLKFPEK